MIWDNSFVFYSFKFQNVAANPSWHVHWPWTPGRVIRWTAPNSICKDERSKYHKLSLIIYVYIQSSPLHKVNYHHHHHHVMPPARISLTLSLPISLSFIASGRSSGLHPVSSHSCWMYVRVGRPAFARPYVGVHRSTSLLSLSLLLQQCPACLVRLT